MKHLEIERKYLLYPCSLKRFLEEHQIPYRCILIEQFYLQSTPEGAERYRRAGDRYIHTVKRGSGVVREEREEEVSREEYLRQKERFGSRLIEKKRYIVKWKGYTLELDAFEGSLKGLNFLEVEFSDPQEVEHFRLSKPFKKLLVQEVSDLPDFTNGSLSKTLQIPVISEALTQILRRVREQEDFLKASFLIEFHPFERTSYALKAQIYAMLLSIRANRQAILSGDRDPERLHQLRVALRKIRALLSEMKAFFDRRWQQTHRERLAELMRLTGPKRDLDVYLMQIDSYERLVQQRYREGLERLRDFLQKQESKLQEQLEKALRSEVMEEEIEELLRFCLDPEAGVSPQASRPVILSLKEVLFDRYRSILEKGAKLRLDSEPEAYHRLRIRVKKLRYTLEFAASILEPKAYGKMLERLKAIQTILGEHQDLEVQRAHLRDLSRQMAEEGIGGLEAIHALRKEMKKLIRRKRKAFHKEFKHFRKSEKLFRKMICRY